MTQTTTEPNNIIGPFSKEDWIDLIDLRSAVKFMKSQNDKNFFPAIEKYTKLYDEIWDKYFKKAA